MTTIKSVTLELLDASAARAYVDAFGLDRKRFVGLDAMDSSGREQIFGD